MSTIAVRFGGDHPLTVIGYALDGYHRPLGGEVANLTVRAAPSEFWLQWLDCPPLGLECVASVGGVAVMAGYLYGLRVSTAGVELRIEG